MKFRTLFILPLLLLSGQLSAQVNPLTTEQKRNDFLFLYETLEENYPYFGLRKRVNNVDWLANKNRYLNQIETTPNDSLFILALKSIIGELQDGHVNFNCTRYGHEGFSRAYQKAAVEDPHYKTWVDVFESAGSRIDYWAAILKNSERSLKQAVPEPSEKSEPLPNYSDAITPDGLTAILTVRSFNSHKIEEDKEKIDLFLNKLTDCDRLIIDIQQNSGGATRYWKENLVERLIRDTVFFTQYPLIKEGAVNRHFYADFFREAHPLGKTGTLSRIPEELLEESYYIQQETDTISPKNPVDFQGQIYVLVSQEVFSSSEGFAQFCKTTGWATLAGERTGGDGIGSDPALMLLPESKIIIGYPSLVGLNHDGSLNAEERTVPDIEITGKTYKERLDRFIEYLSRDL